LKSIRRGCDIGSTDPSGTAMRKNKMTITRRNILQAGGLSALGLAVETVPGFAALPVPSGNTLSFQIMRKGSRIGTHTLAFSGNGDDLTVNIDVKMAVYLGPIRMFHYTHHDVETWKGGKFVSLDAKTDYNGDAAWCTVRRDGDQLIVQGSKAAKYTAPSNTLAATHWNKAELQGPMINPENGMMLHPKISDVGSCSVALASGTTTPAHQYAWRGKNSLDLWYDTQGDWVALKAVTPSGEVLNYEKL
jgi:hypothetical protein